MQTSKQRITLIADRDAQIKRLSAQAVEINQLTQNITKAQVAWRSRLLGACNDLPLAVRTYEGELIRHALENAGGSVVKAAKSLNMSYQALAYIIDTRQSGLLRFRSVKRSRKGKR